MVGITIRAKGLERTVVDEMKERMRAPERALLPAAQQLIGHVQIDSFRKQADPWGNPWAALAPSTTRKRGKTSSATILVDTGQLRGSLTTRVEGPVIKVGISGAAGAYGAVHQFGGRAKPIPRRAFLPLDENGVPSFAGGWARTWADRTVRRLQKWIAEGKV